VKKHSYSFSTDNKLRIKTWDWNIAELTQKSAASVKGMKYYEVFPRIFVDKVDGLQLCLKNRNELLLKEYCFPCHRGHFYADILIRALEGDDSKSALVEVTISPLSGCPIEKKLQEVQPFIDIGKTASRLAHGVRNPLNAIKGSVVYLKEKYATEPTLIEFAKIMEEEISRLDDFISKFLSRSIEDTGTASVNINTLLKKINVFTALQAHAANVEAIYEYGDIPEIRVNSFQIEQAILNVMNNSIEAMYAGGRLTVRTRLEKHLSRDFIVIGISDTGAGISERRTKAREIGAAEAGRGFGLFIAREVLKSYGGYLEIKSEKGKGTDVMLYLPIATKLVEDL
jgi:two-component system, NtrC family, nitrogen regulation sensor histidine kinase GlnL